MQLHQPHADRARVLPREPVLMRTRISRGSHAAYGPAGARVHASRPALEPASASRVRAPLCVCRPIRVRGRPIRVRGRPIRVRGRAFYALLARGRRQASPRVSARACPCRAGMSSAARRTRHCRPASLNRGAAGPHLSTEALPARISQPRHCRPASLNRLRPRIHTLASAHPRPATQRRANPGAGAGACRG